MRYLVLIICIAVASFSACAEGSSKQRSLSRSSSPPKSQLGKVIRTVDGDTLHVSIGGQDKTVRLIGVDTPETHKPGVKVECGGKEASANMARLAPAGARARLTYDPTQDRVDRYGRLLAYVGVNHRSLNLEQVYAGLAEVYVYRKNFQRVEAYRRAAGVAQRAHRGVWDKCAGDFHSEQPGK